MKTKLLVLLLIVAIFTTVLCSCEVLKFANHVLDFVPKPDNNNDTNININIGGTTAHVHTEGVIPAVESTCTKTGLTEGRYCTSCGDTLVPQEESPLKEHTYDNSVDKYCNVCEHERDIDCSHEGTTEFLPAKESTCTEAGLTQGVRCTLCGEIVVAQQSLPLKDHVSSDWIVDYEATTENDGLRHIECTICGTVTKQETIPMIIPSSEGLEYKLNKDGKSYYLKGMGTCTSQAVVIADVYEGKPVTAIGQSAFYGRTDLISVSIPDSVTRIESNAFYGCSALETIKLGKSIKYFGDSAFTLVNNIEEIYYNGDIASWCSIEFKSFTSSPIHYQSSDLNFYINEKLVTNIDIPNSVTSIGDFAFYHWSFLDSVTIPDSVTSIGHYAFEGCQSLTNIFIPESVETIGSGAFSYCTSLENVSVPDSVVNFGFGMFNNCTSLNCNEYDNAYYVGNENNPYLVLIKAKDSEIESCQINNATRYIESRAFEYCIYLESIAIPNSVTSTGQSVFYGCRSLTDVTLPNSLNVIEHGLFQGCSKLKSIVIPDTVTSIDSNAFYTCSSLEDVVMGNSVETIGQSAFEGCGALTNINLSQSLTKISNNAFAYCHSLERIVIPKSVTEIYSYAFICSEKLTIYCEAKSKPSKWTPQWDYANWQGNLIPVVWGYTGN